MTKNKSTELKPLEPLKTTYNFQPREAFPFFTISDVAEELGTHNDRVARIVKRLGIPVFRPTSNNRGLVFLSKQGRLQVKRALAKNVLRRGPRRRS